MNWEYNTGSNSRELLVKLFFKKAKHSVRSEKQNDIERERLLRISVKTVENTVSYVRPRRSYYETRYSDLLTDTSVFGHIFNPPVILD